MRSTYVLLQEIAGMIASLQEIKLEFQKNKVDDLKSLEVAITMLAMSHEKLEVDNLEEGGDEKETQNN
jgi:hypothetical protein